MQDGPLKQVVEPFTSPLPSLEPSLESPSVRWKGLLLEAKAGTDVLSRLFQPALPILSFSKGFAAGQEATF